jgi:MarR family transcriptional regulator, organic hydroperoxide resistance regulator
MTWTRGQLKMTDAVTAERIYFRFLRLRQQVFAEMAHILKPLNLSIPQFDVLSTLTEQDGLSQSDLAEKLYVTKGNVSGLIDRLAEAGYVERRATPGDRRANAVILTASGREVAEAGISLQRQFVAETLGKLPQEDMARLDEALKGWRQTIRERRETA